MAASGQTLALASNMHRAWGCKGRGPSLLPGLSPAESAASLPLALSADHLAASPWPVPLV